MDDPKLFENQIKISVTGKIATLESKNFELVGGNNDYSVVFTFDEPWQEYPVKTAIFTFGDTPVFKVFDGDVCDGVVISNSTACYIGVLAGDLITTTPALIRDIRLSITDVSEGTPEEPTEDVYNQIMELLNRYLEQGGGVGNDGATFIPQISEDGILSWTNDKGLDNPQPVKIVGKDGETPTIEIDDNGFWVIDGYNTGVKAKGEDGEGGKSAYIYAQEAGYTGTEEQFAKDLAKKVPTKTSEITNDSGFITNSDIPVTSVNNKTGAVSLSAGDVGARPDNWTPTATEVNADPKGTASSAVSVHNTSPDSHNDIRLWIQGVADRLNHALDSTDLDLDQLSEIVQYIKSNSSLIAVITTKKINYSDIIDNLTTSVDNRPLSAKQGVALKALIDALQSGKLDASELSTAINTALAQAKASGKFDGADGKSAYEYAKDGGYTGTEQEFAIKLSEDTATKEYVASAVDELEVGFSTIILYMYGEDGEQEEPPTIREIANDEAIAALEQAKNSGDFDGAQGIQGFSIVASVDRPSFTTANWDTYGTVGREENWGGTSNEGVRVGDIFLVVGTATDTGIGHMLVYKYTGVKGGNTLSGVCLAHHIIAYRGAPGPEGKTPVKGTDYYTAADKAEMVNSVVAALPKYNGGVS